MAGKQDSLFTDSNLVPVQIIEDELASINGGEQDLKDRLLILSNKIVYLTDSHLNMLSTGMTNSVLINSLNTCAGIVHKLSASTKCFEKQPETVEVPTQTNIIIEDYYDEDDDED